MRTCMSERLALPPCAAGVLCLPVCVMHLQCRYFRVQRFVCALAYTIAY